MDKDYGFGGWGIVILIALFFLLFAGQKLVNLQRIVILNNFNL